MGLTVNHIAEALGARVEGNGDFVVAAPSEPSVAGENALALAMASSYRDALEKGAAKAAVLWDGADWQALGLQAAIFIDRPRYAMATLTRLFDTPPYAPEGIHETAIVDSSAQIGAGSSIGPFCIIGPGTIIGQNARILSHVSIAENCRIGENALIYQGVRIGARVRIGDGFLCQHNTVIGADGFSYVTPKPGAIDEVKGEGRVTQAYDDQEFVRINSLGSVVIGDNVELGANCAIDRGTVADTTIGNGTKLDNLVQVGHNVRVGKTCLLCGQVGLGGSAVIEDRVVLGGQVGVADHVTVGSNVIAAGKSGISSNVPPNRAIMGNPAILMEANVESYKAYRRLPRLFKKVKELEARLSKLLGD